MLEKDLRAVPWPRVLSAPFERLAIGILGPLPTTTLGNRYIVVICYFTKWPECIALPNQTTETVARAVIQEVFCRFGAPTVTASSMGPLLCPSWGH